MAATLSGIGVVKNVKYGYQEVYNQWSEIVDAVNSALKNQPIRGGIYANYEAALFDGIIEEVIGGYEAEMVFSYPNKASSSFRDALYKLTHSGNLEGLYTELESKATTRPEVKSAYEALQAELQLARTAKLSVQEAAVMDSSLVVENKVASNALKLLKAGGPFVAGVTAADVVVFAKTWLDQLPDTTPQSPEMVELKQYVQEHGPEKANDHMMHQYMQGAEQAQ